MVAGLVDKTYQNDTSLFRPAILAAFWGGVAGRGVSRGGFPSGLIWTLKKSVLSYWLFQSQCADWVSYMYIISWGVTRIMIIWKLFLLYIIYT